MVKKKDLVLTAYLRQDSRIPLTTLSRKTGMPVSTIFDRIKACQGSLILKQTALLDFARLGYSARATAMLKVRKESKEQLREHLAKSFNVNSLYKINNGYDFMVEFVFRNIQELEDYLDLLDERFAVKVKDIHYIIEEIKRENFLCEPDFIDMLFPAV